MDSREDEKNKEREMRSTHTFLMSALILIGFAKGSDGLADAPRATPRAKYVFLMIGDGMASPQRAATEYFLGKIAQANGDVRIDKLLMNTFPAHGMTTTHSANSIITDSAAAGTALACGRKTNSGVVAMDKTLKCEFKTIAEIAKERGMRVGIVSSVSIDHATPACFYSHRPSRKMYYEIAMDLANSNFDYFGGGGSLGAKIAETEHRPSPIDAARKNGFKIVKTRDELAAVKPGEGKVWAFSDKTDSSCALFYEMDRPDDHLSLAEFTRRGVELLDNPNGFFMMVEGGKIDWACHANDAAAVIHEVVAFDKAVAVACEFYEKHPKETLIVVTGDHECGGLTIGFAGTKYESFPEKIAAQTMSHEKFEEVVAKWRMDETPFPKALSEIKRIFGFHNLTPDELNQLKAAYAMSMLARNERAKNAQTYNTYGGHEPLSIACCHLIAHRAGFAWTTFSHTGAPVPTSAVGVGHQRFNGYYDNTDIFKKIASVMRPATVAAE